MEEQIYQAVWCQVFAKAWMWVATLEVDEAATAGDCEAFAGTTADLAAAGAVRKWDESKRHAVITAKTKQQNQESP